VGDNEIAFGDDSLDLDVQLGELPSLHPVASVPLIGSKRERGSSQPVRCYIFSTHCERHSGAGKGSP
jgi:hypothetical protein